MTPGTLSTMKTDQLAGRFVNIALEQDQALRLDDIAKFNRLYGKMNDVVQELKARAGDQRRALLPLHAHPNAQVRLKSAIATLAIDLDASRRILQLISDNDEYPQAVHARGMIDALDRRTYVAE